MSKSPTEIAAICDKVACCKDEYDRAIQLEDNMPDSVSAVELDQLREKWDDAVVELEEAKAAS